MEGWKDIWEKAAYIALRLIATLSIMCIGLYGHHCSYEKKYFFKIFFEDNFLNLVILC